MEWALSLSGSCDRLAEVPLCARAAEVPEPAERELGREHAEAGRAGGQPHRRRGYEPPGQHASRPQPQGRPPRSLQLPGHPPSLYLWAVVALLMLHVAAHLITALSPTLHFIVFKSLDLLMLLYCSSPLTMASSSSHSCVV